MATNSDTDKYDNSDETVIPECEFIFEGGPTPEQIYENCKKNPGHKNFIPVSEFKMEHLPLSWQNDHVMNEIQINIDRTVKVSLSYTSPNRPDIYPESTLPYPFCEVKGSKRAVRVGTGYIETYFRRCQNKMCPCHICKESGQPKMEYWVMVVITATHVIYDDSEAAKAIFECFYDTEERDRVKLLYGIRVWETDDIARCKSDICRIMCVTHEKELYSLLFESTEHRKRLGGFRRDDPPNGLLVSHPNGLSKKITLGSFLHYSVVLLNSNNVRSKPLSFRQTSRYRIPSLSFSYMYNGYESQQLTVGGVENDEYSSWFQGHASHVSVLPSGKTEVILSGLQLDTEYPVPEGLTINPNPNSKHDLWARFDDDNEWCTFPQGTTITSLKGENIIFPRGTEFFLGGGLSTTKQHLTYDIETCPGSSGGAILYGVFSYDAKTSYFFHAGALKDSDSNLKINRSVLV